MIPNHGYFGRTEFLVSSFTLGSSEIKFGASVNIRFQGFRLSTAASDNNAASTLSKCRMNTASSASNSASIQKCSLSTATSDENSASTVHKGRLSTIISDNNSAFTL